MDVPLPAHYNDLNARCKDARLQEEVAAFLYEVRGAAIKIKRMLYLNGAGTLSAHLFVPLWP